MSASIEVSPGLRALVRSLFPEAEVASVEPMGPDATHGRNEKVEGYGRPLRVVVRQRDGVERTIVFHTALPNEFGHDRRADRAAELLLAWDTTRGFPRHVPALDVGAVLSDGQLRSLGTAGEFYLVTDYAEGLPYAADLRRIAEEGTCLPQDLDRAGALAEYLVRLHTSVDRPASYRRAIRDLLGHGEGIFGIVDGYPSDTPAAPPGRLAAIEHKCLEWRWKLRAHEHRLKRTHGDFHPFNVIFGEGPELAVLDASRGCLGDPADDVAAMAINYPFFAIDRPEAWARGLAPLWRRFWGAYLGGSGDGELLDVVAPFLAWRGLVVACPRFYPTLSAGGRDRLLGFVERALSAPRFDPDSVAGLFP